MVGRFAAWLATKYDPNGTGRTATHRSYRKEAERLLLWAILEQGKPPSSLTVEDTNAFKWLRRQRAGADLDDQLIRCVSLPFAVGYGAPSSL